MTLSLLIMSALRSLNNHKTRSLLTTLGIIIGVVAIIAVMSIGQGAKQRVMKEIEKLGSNFIIVIGTTPKQFGQQRRGENITLKQSDVNAIQAECDDINLISRGTQRSVTSVYEGTNWQTLIGGADETLFEIRQWALKTGEFFTAQDVRAGAKVCLIGKTVVKELFGSQDPIGKIIRVKKIPFKVIGVLEEKGRSPDGRDQDDIIFAPITTVQRKIIGKTRLGAIVMSAKSKERLAAAASQIRAVLRQNHRLQPHDEDDFTVFTQDDIAQASEAASQVLHLLLIIIASISLLVGGIGIMNIMLVTVAERTKEIGIRMALGATTTHILRQFILEAIVICLMGGLLGVIFGIGISQLVSITLGWPVYISRSGLLISLSSSIVIGLFFGYYPAYKAAHLNPIDALAER